ncbi:hypothetical protein C8J57DRAFT_1212140 [Mycena rebaudengoi]|nr:hypothetical protein C8J57DRAFT_1212140 [Mycena rebaudengoi]
MSNEQVSNSRHYLRIEPVAAHDVLDRPKTDLEVACNVGLFFAADMWSSITGVEPGGAVRRKRGQTKRKKREATPNGEMRSSRAGPESRGKDDKCFEKQGTEKEC